MEFLCSLLSNNGMIVINLNCQIFYCIFSRTIVKKISENAHHFILGRMFSLVLFVLFTIKLMT